MTPDKEKHHLQREKLPSQAEGAAEQPEALTQDYPIPSQAEGEREDVEKTLREQENKQKKKG